MKARNLFLAVLGIAGSGCSGDGPTPPPPPSPPSVTISTHTTSIMAGDLVVVSITTSNIPNPTCDIQVNGGRKESQNGCVSVTVVSDVAGTVIITVTARGSNGSTATSTPLQLTASERPGIVFRGQIHLLNPQNGDSPEGWVVSVVVTGENKVSTLTDGSGNYALPSVKNGATRKVIITIEPSANSRYGPLYLETSTAFSDVRMEWPVLPRSCWVIMRGIYTGNCQSIDFDEFLLPPGNSGDPFFPVQKTNPVSSPFGNYVNPNWYYFGGYPQPVAISHSLTTTPLSPTDSVKIWGPLEEMERITGFDYFRPGTELEVTTLRHGMLFYIDSTLPSPGGAGGAGFLSDPNSIIFNYMVVTHAKVHDIGQLYREDLQVGFPRIIQHEFIHGLGFHHVTTYNSLMSGPAADGYSATANYSYELTLKDVLYLEVARELTLSQKTYNTRLGIAERLNGLYVLEQGKSPSVNQFLP